MARLVSRAPFDPSKPVIVKRPFTANGRPYAVGDVFPWRQQAIAQRKALQLYDSGRLMHAAEEPEAPVSINRDLAAIDTRATPVPAAAQEQEDLDAQAPAEETPADELDLIDDLAELRAIAEAEGAEFKRSKADQREAIRENRAEKAASTDE